MRIHDLLFVNNAREACQLGSTDGLSIYNLFIFKEVSIVASILRAKQDELKLG